VPEQPHQGVHTDLGVGEFGREGVSQPVHQRAVGALGVDAGAAEGPQHPVLQGAAGDSLAVGTDEQRRGGGPRGESPGGERRMAAAGKRATPVSRYPSRTFTSGGYKVAKVSPTEAAIAT
jgi:hypothetical protein